MPEWIGCKYCAKTVARGDATCRWCGRDLLSESAIVEADHPLELTERRAVLQTRIAAYVASGYRMLAQTETTAQLVRPKEFSFLLAAVSFLFCGVGVLFYLFYYASQRDQTVYIEVTETGGLIERH